jgi:hypothetical protein
MLFIFDMEVSDVHVGVSIDHPLLPDATMRHTGTAANGTLPAAVAANEEEIENVHQVTIR